VVLSYIICIAASVALYVVLKAANKKKAAAVAGDEVERAKLAFQDLTDMENPYFRYVL
jgi:nanoRNase/pAp phosphatase (c-di-AMP/oligoRNAs hydrolase)